MIQKVFTSFANNAAINTITNEFKKTTSLNGNTTSSDIANAGLNIYKLENISLGFLKFIFILKVDEVVIIFEVEAQGIKSVHINIFIPN